MVEILNLLVLLGFRGGWSVCSPEWRKCFILVVVIWAGLIEEELQASQLTYSQQFY